MSDSLRRQSIEEAATKRSPSLASSNEELRDLESLYDSSDSSEVLESLILVHVPASFFRDIEKKRQLESMFLELDGDAHFIYLKSFRRARVDFSSRGKASTARDKFDGLELEGEKLRCYFAQKLSEKAEQFLKPPPLEKQFLISPPMSPVVGYEQPKEGAPKTAPPADLLGFDIAQRLAGLTPNATHEVHHGTDDQPSVFVHTAGSEAFSITKTECMDDGREKPEITPMPHTGAIPKTPKPNYTPPNYAPK